MSQQTWAKFFDPDMTFYKPTPGTIYKSKQTLQARSGLFKNTPTKLIRMDGDFLQLFQRLLRNLKVENRHHEDDETALRLQTNRERIIDELMTAMTLATDTQIKKKGGRCVYTTGYFAEGSAITISHYDFPIPHIANLRGGMLQIEINATHTDEVLYQRRVFILTYEEDELDEAAKQHYRTCSNRDRVNRLGNLTIDDAVTNYILEITPYQPLSKAS